MKTKKFNTKLALNKKTVANLNPPDMQSLRGGAFSIYSCAITREGECATDYLCTDPVYCKCTWTCTLPCPITTIIPC